MKVAEIWRYPVKTMAGEKLQHLEGQNVVSAGPRALG